MSDARSLAKCVNGFEAAWKTGSRRRSPSFYLQLLNATTNAAVPFCMSLSASTSNTAGERTVENGE